MATTFLSDEVISSTQLRTNQKHWFAKASEGAVTIVNGRNRKLFTLIDRERISNLYTQKYYMEMILEYCYEIIKGIKSTIFPWAESLSEEEKAEFHNEILDCVRQATATGDWSSIENLLDDWKATALVESNPKIAGALLEKEARSKYIEIKD
jgi:hypothetical protein